MTSGLVTITEAGYAKEQDALADGVPLPKLDKIVLGAGPVHAEPHLATTIDAWHEAPILAFERLSPGALKLTAEIGADVEGRIREIGVVMEDGTLYGYLPYQVEADGLFKAQGFAFTFYVIISREDVTHLEVTYAPLDVDALAQEIADEASARIDAKTDATIHELLKFTASVANQNLVLAAEVQTMKGQRHV